MSSKFYRTFAEFEREYVRPNHRLGMTVEEMVEDKPFEREFDFDKDPYEESDDDDDDEY
jgi:hypothetical protein